MAAQVIPKLKAKRVLHIVPALFGAADGVVGGAERYALELARHMADEIPTTLVSFGERERHETLGQLKIHVIGNPWYVRSQRTNPISLSLVSELRKADVIHCHQQHVLASSVAALTGKLTGRRVFVSDLGGGGWDVSAYVSTDRWYHGHLHISDYSRRIFGQAENDWAHVIWGGVDARKFSPSEAAESDGSILFVGRLLPHKGIDDLIQAVTPAMKMKIIGRALHAEYFEHLKELARDKQVEFVLDCDDEELIAAYRRGMCVVLPSVYKTIYGEETRIPELLGQTLLEGMACGLPAICTNVAGMPEVVDDGVTGFIVPPNDPNALRERLIWLIENPAKAKAMGQAGRQRILDKFTWPTVVRRCLEIYASKANGCAA
jgi:glycosyltransferase involved in cell wall biosynthesis